MSGLSGVGYGGYNPIQQYQQNLFNQIDTNGDGLVSQAELEQAVTGAGGSQQAADALYAELDPNNSGGFTEQQLAQVLPGPAFSGQMQSQMISFQAQGWPGAAGGAPGALAQNLFAQIDSNGDGSISKSELEQAVTAAGGTQQAADALYAKLDPNGTGSVDEQQFAQGLSQAAPHHHHHGGGAHGASAGDALTSLFDADSGGASNSPTQIAQNIFSAIDSDGDGSITQNELEQAVTAAGGTAAGADALYAKLDPNGTGSVSEQQFINALQPPSSGGNTAQDALLALLSQATQDTASTAATSTPANGTAPIGAAVATGADPASSTPTGNAGTNGDTGTNSNTGNTAQDALQALLNASGASPNGQSSQSAATLFSQVDLANAFALYQNQLMQQLMGSISPMQSAVI